jgi:hypothetical protein
MPPKPKKKSPRVTRSISFEIALMSHCKKRARELRRTVNWVVNEMIRADDNNAPSAAAEPAGS